MSKEQNWLLRLVLALVCVALGASTVGGNALVVSLLFFAVIGMLLFDIPRRVGLTSQHRAEGSNPNVDNDTNTGVRR